MDEAIDKPGEGDRVSGLDAFLSACAKKLPPPSTWSSFPGYPDSLALAVIDAIWSIGVRYATPQGVVERYSAERTWRGAAPANDSLPDLLGFYEALGGIEPFINRVGTRHRVSTQPGAALKGAVVHEAAQLLHGYGIDTAAQFRDADRTSLGAQAAASWKTLPGQGSGISWRYLRMLLGLADVKPDRMVTRFAASALGVAETSLDQAVLISLVRAAADYHDVDLRALDHEIWKYQSARSSAQQASSSDHLKALATAFVDCALPILEAQHVIPTSRFQPFIQVGHHYEGPDFMSLPEFIELEEALAQAYPERFAESANPLRREFANAYVFRFLEAVVARQPSRDRDSVDAGDFIERSANDLIATLDSDQHEVVCCRAVMHLTSDDGSDVQIGNITVCPERGLHESNEWRVQTFIPAALNAFHGEPPFVHGPPESLLVLKVTVERGEDPYLATTLASEAIDRFMLLARLLHAGTHTSGWQVTGPSTLIAPLLPSAVTYPHGQADWRVQRTVRLSDADGPAFTALSQYIDAADVKRDGMVTTSFDTARHHYNRAHEAGDDFERIIDLATALEAVLTGSDTDHEGVSLRLKSRAAALLATDADPASTIFSDLGHLYNLRSTLVHGGPLTEKKLKNMILGVSTVPGDDGMFGIALAAAVDRLRDLTRRSFLARLCLASSPASLWPFDKTTAVDKCLADDATRAHWRTYWRDQLTALGAGYAADAARPGTRFGTEEQ